MEATLETKLDAVNSLAQFGRERDLRRLFTMMGDSDWQTRRAAVEAIVTILNSSDSKQTVDRACAELIEAVLSTDFAGKRASAIATLEAMGKPALPALARALKNAPASGRIALAGVIGSAGGPAAVRLLAPLAGMTSETNVSAAAIAALGKTAHTSAADVLLNLLGIDNEWLKFSVIGALGELGDERAVDPLESMLDTGLLEEVVCVALVEIGTLKALDALLRNLFDAHGEVRETILSAVVSIYNEERSRPRAFTEAIRGRARDAIRQSANEWMIARLLDLFASRDAARARHALTVLGWIASPDFARVIIDALSDASLFPIARAALSDGALNELFLERLVELTPSSLSYSELANTILGLDSPTAIKAAVKILCEASDAEAVEAALTFITTLRGKLELSGTYSHRGLVAGVLIDLIIHALSSVQGRSLVELVLLLGAFKADLTCEDREQIERLLERSSDIDGTIARLFFLEQVDHEHARSAANSAQRHRDSAVRLAAIQVIELSELDSSYQAFHQMATDESTAVRRAAVRAMRRGAGNDDIRRALIAATVDGDVWVRAAALESLGDAFGDLPLVRNILMEATATSHPLCRVSAIRALSKCAGANKVVWERLARVAREDEQSEVRRLAVVAFRRCTDKAARLSVSRRALNDISQHVQLAAVDVLAELPDDNAVQALLKVASSRTRSVPVRGAALKAIASFGHPLTAKLSAIALTSGDLRFAEDGFEALSKISSSPMDEIKERCDPRSLAIAEFALSSTNQVNANMPSAAETVR